MFQFEYMTRKREDNENYTRKVIELTEKDQLTNSESESLSDTYNDLDNNEPEESNLRSGSIYSNRIQHTTEMIELMTKNNPLTIKHDKFDVVECKYNNLIQHNKSQEEPHFSIINDNVRKLIDKTRVKQTPQNTVEKPNRVLNGKIHSVVSLADMRQVYIQPSNLKHSYLNNKESDFEERNKAKVEICLTEIDNVKENRETSTSTPKNVIPAKFRDKKLPYLDKCFKTGYIKFFDEKNHFGFMTLTTEPFGEVFVFGNEFDKAKINPDFLSLASNNPQIVFTFRVMYYMGRHGESKKAVNIRF